MSERDLHRAVARATGETVDCVQRRGFRLAEDDIDTDFNLGPLVIDWDTRQPARLGEVLSEDDWPTRVSPIHSYDEDVPLEDEFESEAERESADAA